AIRGLFGSRYTFEKSISIGAFRSFSMLFSSFILPIQLAVSFHFSGRFDFVARANPLSSMRACSCHPQLNTSRLGPPTQEATLRVIFERDMRQALRIAQPVAYF